MPFLVCLLLLIAGMLSSLSEPGGAIAAEASAATENSPPAVAGSSVSSPTSLQPYMMQLIDIIKPHYYAPKDATEVVVVNFRIHRDGTLSDLSTVNSSALCIAGEAASKAIASSAPFPPLPGDAPQFIDVQVRFAYDPFHEASYPYVSLLNQKTGSFDLCLSLEQKQGREFDANPHQFLKPYLEEVGKLCKKAWKRPGYADPNKRVGLDFFIWNNGNATLGRDVSGGAIGRGKIRTYGIPDAMAEDFAKTILAAGPFPHLPAGVTGGICVQVIFDGSDNPQITLLGTRQSRLF